MSRKFPILNSQSQVTPSTAKAVANATPLTHAFADLIMSNYTGKTDNGIVDENQKLADDLFKTFPADDHTKRLASVVELITGIKPAINKDSLKVGKLFKVNNVVYAVVWVNGQYAYGINANATINTSILTNCSTKEGNSAHVTIAEAGHFCKEILAVKGNTLVTYIASFVGGPALATFFKEVNHEVI